MVYNRGSVSWQVSAVSYQQLTASGLQQDRCPLPIAEGWEL